MDPVTGKERQFHIFTGAVEGQALNVLSLSRSLPDPRGGLGEAGSDPALVALTHSIKLSARRCSERHGAPVAAAAGASAGGAAGAMPAAGPAAEGGPSS